MNVILISLIIIININVILIIMAVVVLINGILD